MKEDFGKSIIKRGKVNALPLSMWMPAVWFGLWEFLTAHFVMTTKDIYHLGMLRRGWIWIWSHNRSYFSSVHIVFIFSIFISSCPYRSISFPAFAFSLPLLVFPLVLYSIFVFLPLGLLLVLILLLFSSKLSCNLNRKSCIKKRLVLYTSFGEWLIHIMH